jgi:hypothetical protein
MRRLLAGHGPPTLRLGEGPANRRGACAECRQALDIVIEIDDVATGEEGGKHGEFEVFSFQLSLRPDMAFAHEAAAAGTISMT